VRADRPAGDERATESLALAGEEFWNDYWKDFALPAEITKSQSLYLDEITSVFDRYLRPNSELSVLEIGGAPGQYLAYLQRQFGYRVWAVDSSNVGCRITRRNFELLGIPGEVVEGDIVSDELDLPRFDIVYSLGLIEHAASMDALVELVRAHVRYLEERGLLILGCPNFRGINRLALQRLAPDFLSLHNLEVMDIRTWENFARPLRLELVWKGYVGGLEPALWSRCETGRVVDRALARAARAFAALANARWSKALRRLNSRAWSGYVMGVYRAPAS
jgi:SAM-dependent methyltransferase